MCGIFGYIGSNINAPALVLEGLKSLEYRGYDSWGVAVLPNGGREGEGIVVKKRVGKIGDANVDDLPSATLALGHTRWATHGRVTQANAHPHLDCSESIAIVHNGIFENYAEIKAALITTEHRFVSETDSEVIAHLIEEELEKKVTLSEAVRQAFLKMEGMGAVIVVQKEERELIVARNGSPLVLGYGNGENFIASDPSALLGHTKNVYFLEDGEMAVIRQESITVKQIKSGKDVSVHPQQVEWNFEQAQKGTYQHYMLKEIHEQLEILRRIAEEDHHSLQVMADQLNAATQIICMGCGSSSYEALVGKRLFETIAKKKVDVVIGSEADYAIPFVDSNCIIIALSQSGETMDILEPLKKMHAKGAKILAITNSLGSSLYRMADKPVGEGVGNIVVGAGPEKAVASTKAMIAKIAYLFVLAHLMDNLEIEGKKRLQQVVITVKDLLSTQSVENIHQLAITMKDHQHLYVIGRGLSYPVALEAALKIKEISYMHAEAVVGGELKHGPLALIEQGTPCLVFLPDDDLYALTLSSAMEIKARGGYLIGVGSTSDPIFDKFIRVNDAGLATVIAHIIFAQLFAYFLSTEKGLDPDMPRNLAKSVTVR